MLGIQFIKVQPTEYVLQYSKGKLTMEGAGVSFFYFAPTTSLVRIPIGSIDVQFIFKEVTSDFQELSVQGQITYRISEPKKIAQLLNFTINAGGHDYTSSDPEKLAQRIINTVQVLMRAELQSLTLKNSLRSSDTLVQKIKKALKESEIITSLGLDILGLSILAIKPNPETSRALEAEVREQVLKDADEAIYDRRNASVEKERAIKENELNTEVAIENKKRQIREAQMDAERSIQEKKRQMMEEEMKGKIALEEKNKELVALAVENSKKEADAKGYGIKAVAAGLSGMDVKVIQSLTSVGMDPAQLIAQAFRDLAQGAEKIGQLNVSPDLLRELIGRDGNQ